MSSLVQHSCLFRDLYKGLFDFRRDFDQIFHRYLIHWPFRDGPPSAF